MLMQTLADITNISAKDIVIVANNRQVLALKQQFGKECGTMVLPQITTINNLISNNCLIPVLDDFELFILIRKLLWQQNIKFNNQAIQDIIHNYQKLRQYKISIKDLDLQNNVMGVFALIIEKYYKYKQQHNLVDIFDLYAKFNKSGSYYYFGFKSLNPLDREFLTTIDAQELPSKNLQFLTNNTIFRSDEDEIKSAIKWACDLYAQDRSKSIVLVHPQLEDYKHKFSYYFNQTFDEFDLQTKDKSFNISLGNSLLQYKMATDLYLALSIIYDLSKNSAKITDLIKLISSNYFDFSYDLVAKIEAINSEILPTEHLSDLGLESLLIEIPKNLSYTDYLIELETILNHLGFLANKNLSSDEYQLLVKIKQELQNLTKNSQQVSFKTFLGDVHYIFSTAIFSPQSGERQIQVMGMLEAEGLNFDYAWVMGLNQDILPAPLNPPEYLAVNVCQKFGVAHCDFTHNLIDAKLSIKLLKNLANEVNFSCALMINEVAAMPSLMLDWQDSVLSFDEQKNANNYKQIQLKNIATHFVGDKLKSAIKVINSQNLCPFSGFATRLNLMDEQEKTIGISPIDKGLILHKSLELIYQQIKNKSQLKSLGNEDKNQLINSSLSQAMQGFSDDILTRLSQEYFAQKITKFLELELKRDDFEVITTEGLKTISMADLKITIRLDRVDRDVDGKIIILDYKTGGVSIKSVCERLTQVQLPIYTYAVASNAVGFIEFKDEPCYKYIADDKILPTSSRAITKCDNNYAEQQELWHKQLVNIITNFKNGDARIIPSDNACKYCNLDSLCRKNDL
jgi:RecB family exonuclease